MTPLLSNLGIRPLACFVSEKTERQFSNAWLREGLYSARVSPGAPGKPALYDGDQAIRWYNANKARGPFKPRTLADLRAVIGEDRPSRRPAPTKETLTHVHP